MGKLFSSGIQAFIGFTNKSLVKNLIVITLCIAFFFVQLFYPYSYYASGMRKPNSTFQVGIHYVYEQDELDQIYGEVSRIHDLGFKVIRINLECNPLEYDDPVNQKTDMFFSATDKCGLDVALVIQNFGTSDQVNYYLDRWGSHLKYIQVLHA